FHVLVNSFPNNLALENEALNVFNKYPKFFIHNRSELISSLPPNIFDKYLEGKITEEFLSQIFLLFNSSNLLLVSIKKLDEVDDIYFYEITGDLYQPGLVQPIVSFFQYGLSRDRRPVVPVILMINLILLLLSIVAFIIFVRRRNSLLRIRFSLIWAPFLGFLLGRLTPWAVAPILQKISPGLDSYATMTFWWPCLSGAILLLLPLLIYRFGLTRTGILPDNKKPSGHIPGVFMATTLGISAYFVTLALVFHGYDGIILILPWSIITLLFGYFLGRTLDSADPFPLWLSIPLVLISLFLGALFYLADIKLSFISALIFSSIAAFSVPYISKNQKLLKKEFLPAEETTFLSELIPQTQEELIQRIAKPSYVKLSSFYLSLSKINTFFNNQITYLVLAGPSGTGKTATAKAILKEIETKKCQEKKPVIFLCGQGHPDSTGIPFQPFQSAFAEHFGINLSASVEGQYRKLESSLGELINNMIPFSSLIFPSISEDATRHSNIEIFKSVSYLIRQLTEKQSVVLFIDDLHWIDQSSFEMLSFLRDEFPPDSPIPLLFIFTTRDISKLAQLKLEQHVITFSSTSLEERINLLTGGIGLSRSTAERITNNLGTLNTEKGELYWLLLSVDYLARLGAFIYDPKGWIFDPQFLKANKNNLPLPEEFKSAIKEAIRAHPEYLWILECAACIGLEFDAHTLADSLSLPRLEMLKILKEIEEKTGFIVDLRETDDYFSFTSSFLLQAFREELQIKLEGPKSKSVPQLIREFHARIAQAKEQRLDELPLEIFAVAKHYYASGIKYARKGIDYCRKAAEAAAKLFQFSEARTYLSMAEECAQAIGLPDNFPEDRLKIILQEAHVTGVGAKEAVREGLDFIEKNPEISLPTILMIIRACYEAREFEKAIVLAEQILKDPRATALEKAEAYHFIGISLPPSNISGRANKLREAMNLISTLPETTAPVINLKARVANSLAEILTYGDEQNRIEAMSLFQLSINIKRQREYNDLPGLARSYGGLGRLYLTLENTQMAIKCFEKDLEISRQIGDLSGQMIMLSLIGKCRLKNGDISTARANYQESLEIAERIDSLRGKFYAVLGILECYCLSNDIEHCETLSNRLIDILSLEKAYDILALKELLNKYQHLSNMTWYKNLQNKIQEYEHV
ncbi:MAG: AAA family ATPase, partial [Candidatus Jordarchaeaceae archaeon]